jgi:transcription termination/antitermination protein NusA
MTNLNIIEALGQIAREKNVDREMVIETLTDALVSAAKKRYGNADNFEVQIDAESGRMTVLARKTVVEDVAEAETEIDVESARLIDSQAQLGAVVFEELNLADFGRNAIQTAKQILIQRVREAEREHIYEEFAGRIAQVDSGVVQQISHGDIILNLGRAEAAIPLKEQIRRERYRQGDTVRGYIFEVLKSARGPQVLLSRTHPELLRKLFATEVPEIAEGIVQIHAVAREPGERAKIAVSSNDERVDPVGACVGVKGSRVQAIVRELSGERIDIVPYIDEADIFISRALSPATVSRVITDERRHHAQVIVDDSQLSLAIGKSGQNSRLAVQLTGWGLDIITDEEYQRRLRRLEDSKVELRRLEGVSELISLSLATSGFISIRSIAEAETDMLRTVPGLEGQGEAAQLRARAVAFVEQAEAQGEALRPATLDELEAEERVAAQLRAAQSAAEAAAAEAAQLAADAAEEEAKAEAAQAAAVEKETVGDGNVAEFEETEPAVDLGTGESDIGGEAAASDDAITSVSDTVVTDTTDAAGSDASESAGGTDSETTA